MWRRGKNWRKLQLRLLAGFKTVTRWSRSGYVASFFFFVTVIALTKAGTSEVVAADQTGEMPMVKSPEPGTGQNKQGLSTVGLAALPSPGHRDLETSGTHAGLFLGTKWHKVGEPR